MYWPQMGQSYLLIVSTPDSMLETSPQEIGSDVEKAKEDVHQDRGSAARQEPE